MANLTSEAFAQDFLARLRQTFRAEAAEHVAAIRQACKNRQVEDAYRAAHTLKGAARSVSLAPVEDLARELESFLGQRKQENDSGSDLLTAVEPVLDLLASICEKPGESLSPKDQRLYRECIRALGRKVEEPSAPEAAPVEPATAEPAELSREGTVRISTQRLAAVFLQSEELVDLKVVLAEEAAQLKQAWSDFCAWRRRTQSEDYLFLETFQTSLEQLSRSLHRDASQMGRTVDRLLEHSKSALMLPCSSLTDSLRRLARELARDLGKHVDFAVHEEPLELDRRVVEELRTALLHLLRNAIDHGVGKGVTGHVSLTLSAHGGQSVEILFVDDGPGVDFERVKKAGIKLNVLSEDADDEQVLKCLFTSGLTTSPIITDISGRGLGLAIVKEKIEGLGGSLTLASRRGLGTQVRILVPVTLQTFRGVCVGAGDQSWMFPTVQVERVVRLRRDDIFLLEDRPVAMFEGHPVPVAQLCQLLGFPRMESTDVGVVARSCERRAILLVNELMGEQEARAQELPIRVPGLAAASVSPTGGVVPIVDVKELLDLLTSRPARPLPVEESRVKSRVLVVEDSITARTLLKSILEGDGFHVTTAVDGVDGLTLLQNQEFDAVVCDVDMPRMNGFELTAKIRADASLSRLPVLLVTALSSPRDREYGLAVGANAYIVKSNFEQSNLLEILRRFI